MNQLWFFTAIIIATAIYTTMVLDRIDERASGLEQKIECECSK